MRLDINKLENTIKIMKNINKYRAGLEFSGLYNILMVLGKYIDKPRGVWNIAPKSMGKGESIKIGEIILNKKRTIKRDKLTDTYLIKFLQKNPEILLNGYINLIVEDMSTIVDSSYHIDIFFNLVSKLLWDLTFGSGTNEIIDDTKEKQKNKDDTIELNGVSVLVAGTPKNVYHVKYNYMAYETMWKDRLTEYFYLFDKETYNKIQNNIVEYKFNPIDISVYQKKIKELIELPKPKKVDISVKCDRQDIVDTHFELFHGHQHSFNRGINYLITDLKSLAYINGRKEVTETDIAFYNLFYPNLIMNKFSRTDYLILFMGLINNDFQYIRNELDFGYKYFEKCLYRSKLFNYSRSDGYLKIPKYIIDKLGKQKKFIDKYIVE